MIAGGAFRRLPRCALDPAWPPEHQQRYRDTRELLARLATILANGLHAKLAGAAARLETECGAWARERRLTCPPDRLRFYRRRIDPDDVKFDGNWIGRGRYDRGAVQVNGRAVAELCDNAGLSGRALWKRAGCSDGSVRTALNGGRLTRGILSAIAGALGVPAEEISSGSGGARVMKTGSVAKMERHGVNARRGPADWVPLAEIIDRFRGRNRVARERTACRAAERWRLKHNLARKLRGRWLVHPRAIQLAPTPRLRAAYIKADTATRQLQRLLIERLDTKSRDRYWDTVELLARYDSIRLINPELNAADAAAMLRKRHGAWARGRRLSCKADRLRI